MACPDLSIPGIDANFYQQIVKKALDAGATFDGDRWQIAHVELAVRHDPSSDTLHVICTKKPFLISCAEVSDKITELIQKAKETA